MKTSIVSEALGASIWAASGVAVAGYTWSAFKGTYAKFPGATNPGNLPPAPQAGFNSPYNKDRSFGPGVAASHTVPGTNVPSPGNIPKGGKPGPGFKQSVAPPGNLVAQLKHDLNAGGGIRLYQDWLAIMDWAGRNGVAQIQVKNWAAKQPFYTQLRLKLPGGVL